MPATYCWVGGLLDWILEGEDDDRFGSPKPGQDPVRAHRGLRHYSRSLLWRLHSLTLNILPSLSCTTTWPFLNRKLPGSKITLTVDASTGGIQARSCGQRPHATCTSTWPAAPTATRSRHGGGLSLKPVGSAEAAWRQRGFSPSPMWCLPSPRAPAASPTPPSSALLPTRPPATPQHSTLPPAGGPPMAPPPPTPP